MKKLLSRILAVVMVLSMAIGAQAQEKARLFKVADMPQPKSAKAFKAPMHKAQAMKFKAEGLKKVHKHASFAKTRNLAPALAPGAGSDSFTGSIIYSPDDDLGMYRFSTGAPCVYEPLALGDEYSVSYGGCVAGDGMYYMNYVETFFNYILANVTYVYDYETWELVQMVQHSDESLANCAYSMTYDPTTDNIYGCFMNEDGTAIGLATFDTETLTSQPIADFEIMILGMAVGKDGVLYGFTPDGTVVSIDKETAALTEVAQSDALASDYLVGAATDPISGLIYYSANTDDYSTLNTFDPATKEIATVYDFPNEAEVSGLAFTPVFAEAKAPAAGVINSLEFEGTSLTGKLSFTAPTEFFDGTAASGSISYEFTANGEVIAKGSKVDWGHTYTTYVTVPADGQYTFALTFTNATGAGPAVKVKKYVGADAPAASESVTAAWAAGKMTITWDAVDHGAHDGTIGTITYNVYDADGTALAEGLSATTYTFDLVEPKNFSTYQYYVVAVSDGIESEATYSNVVKLGAMSTPYSNALITESDLTDWTIIDLSGGKTWTPTGTETGGTSISYDASIAKDDWLISPAFNVEKNKIYTISIMYKGGSSYYPEEMEFYLGNAPEVAAMTDMIYSETVTVGTTDWQVYSYEYTAAADGKLCFGIHAAAEEDMLVLYVKNFSISAGIAATAPAQATDLNVVVATDGTPKATLTYTAPSTTVNGAAFTTATKLTRIETYVNGVINSVDNNPVSGAVTSFEYTAPASGSYEFKVVAYNANGAGAPAIANAYLGINVPGAPTNLQVTEVSDGVIDITWDAPASDIDGNYINPALITYTVVELFSEEIVAEGINQTKIENLQVVPEGQQTFVQYAVLAETEMGAAQDYALSEAYAVGTPDKTPWFENGVSLAHEMIYEASSYCDLYFIPDGYFSDLSSRNSDGGFFGINAQYSYESATLTSAKIAVTTPGAVFTFYQAGIGGESNKNTIVVDIICDGETESHTFVQNTPAGEWEKKSIDLAAYVGKTIQFSLTGNIVNMTWIIFDDLYIGEPVAYDLIAKNISAPETVATEEAFDIEYTIYNDGAKAATGYKVSLYADGELVETAEELPEIAVGETYTGTFSHAAYSMFEAGTYCFNYVVEFEGDAEQGNNVSKNVFVKIAASELPAVDIAGTIDENKVTITWETPMIDVTSGIAVTESFESASYEAFTTENFGGWTLANYNTSSTYGFTGISFTNSGNAFGWILFDTSMSDPNSTEALAPYEGTCMMGAFAHESGANDAWLISPALSGAAQTVTFMAKANTLEYGPESMECYVSTAGKEKGDFTQVTIKNYDGTQVTEDWVEYSIDVPAGATYFAIRSTATDCFILWVDYVTYEIGSPYADLELTGFDIYRDEEKIASVGVGATEYVDTLADEGKYTYNVVAVYNNGKSAPSNDVTVEWSGIADAAVAKSCVAVEHKTIVVTGAADVTIVAADGKVITAAKGEAEVKATVPAGVYVVKTNDKVAKVIVK